MPLLYFFAFLSGLVTIFAPCIWPILPIVLAASVNGGHRKPLGITLGVIISFGVLTLALSYILKFIPFDPNILRYVAAAIIALLGLTLVVPKFSGILEGAVSRLSGRFQVGGAASGTGFWPGFIIGLSLGVVWAPCAGPILATIAALAATQKVSLDLILVTVFYVIGVGIPLFIFATVGRKIFTQTRRLNKYTGIIQRIFGVIMIITALLIVTNYDKVISAKLLNVFPSFGNGLTALESTGVVTQGLNELKGTKNETLFANEDSLFNANTPAPDFIGITNWLNTDGKPLTIADLKGKVVLVDFWTYTCINCIRTLPYVTSWYDKYHDKGFVVVGIHTPEFEFEKNTKNVENAIKQYKINYPVGQDNNYATWNNYSNQYWPAEYLIDAQGNIRRTHFGEGEYDQMEEAIQKLLKENGQTAKMPLDTMPDQTPREQISPETYLGSARMAYYYPGGRVGNGTQKFILSQNIPKNSFSFGGEWAIADESSRAISKGVLTLNFYAKNVYLVLKPGTDTGKVEVLLDGKVVGKANAGADVNEYGDVLVDTDKLYHLIKLPEYGEHTLQLKFSDGVEAFAFTFG